MDPDEVIRTKYELLRPVLDERQRRLWAAAEALGLGRGGKSAVSRAIGISRMTLNHGIAELQQLEGNPPSPPPRQQRIRAVGGGRKPLEAQDPTLRSDLERLVNPVTRGDPESPLRWTCKSVVKLTEELTHRGHRVSRQKVWEMLDAMGYSMQSARKTEEGSSHPDRDAQFQYINERTEKMQAQGQPVISVDTKKKELIGRFKNGGQEWQPKGQPESVHVYDFPSLAQGKAIPYGVYDVTENQGFVNVGVSHDTPEFAVHSIQAWWQQMGHPMYPQAQGLLVVADGGGSNGYRDRMWKVELQKLADQTGLVIHVSHMPPGTSKWNQIEHRLFCHITENWRGRPLVSHEAVVELIGATRTAEGLQVHAVLDEQDYATGIKASDDQMAHLQLHPDPFHGEWNYTLLPRSRTTSGFV